MIYWKHVQPTLNATVCFLFKKIGVLWCLMPLSTIFFNSIIKKQFITCKHIVNETFIGETICDPYENEEC